MIKRKYNKILIFLILTILFLNSHISLASTDIGQVQNKISITKNEGTKLIEIVNSSDTEQTIDKTKFHQYYESIKSMSNIGEYTLKIKDKILLPTDSSEFFQEMKFKNIEFENAKLLTKNVTDMSLMFYQITSNPDVSAFDTSKVRNMSNMFSNTTTANPDVSNWDVSKVENFSAMFSEAQSATPNTSTWITESATNMNSMFDRAVLANPDVSNWNVSKVKTFISMFNEATIANPNIDNWQFNEAREIDNMFHNNYLISPNILVNKQFPKLESMVFFYFVDGTKNEKVYINTVPYLTNVTNIDDILDGVPAFGFISLPDMENVTVEFKKKIIKRIVVKKNTYIIKEKISGNKIVEFEYTDFGIPQDVYNQLQDDIVYVLETHNTTVSPVNYDTQIDNLAHLTNNQKEALKTEINQQNNDTEKQNIFNKAKELNEKMKNLSDAYQGLVLKKDKVPTNESLIKYNEIRQKVKDTLDNTTELNKENINSLTTKYTDVYLAIAYIDKEDKKQIIQDLNKLTDQQKKLLKGEIDTATDEDTINNIISKATSLNDSMKALDDLDKTEVDINGVSQTIIDEYNTVKSEVSNVLSSSDDTNKINIDNLKNKLQEAINKLKKDKLNNKKIEAKKEINLLNNLTDDEKTEYNNNINTADTSTKIDEIVANAKSKDASNLQAEKNRISSLIDNLNYLNNNQKQALKNEITPISIMTELAPILTKARELNEIMGKLDETKTLLENFVNSKDFSKISQTKQDELKELLEKAKTLLDKTNGENKTKEEVMELLQKISIPTIKDLTPYISKAKALYFNRTDIVSNFDKDVYMNVELASPIVDIIKNIDNVEIPKIMGGVQTGFNIDLLPDIKLGLFAEYYNQNANHIIFGANYKAPYTLGFIRYRLASIFNEKVFNHNVDIYLTGEYEYKIKDDLNIKPSLGIYISYSAPTKLDKDVLLEKTFMSSLDLKTNLNYKINKLKLYTEVELKLVLGQNQVITEINENYNNQIEIHNNMLQGYLKLGLEKELFNNMIIGTSILFDKSLRFNLNMGYNF